MRSELTADEASQAPRPIIIVCAARSGSKLLRDLLCCAKDCSCYPYDVNYVWKYGNYDVTHDQLTPKMLDKEKQHFIRTFLFRPAKKNNTQFAVEKTVSNSLRVAYVRSVFPDAKIVHLIRDGRDVVASAMDCWQESGASKRNQDYGTTWRKIIEFPHESWRYGIEYLRDNIGMVFGRRDHRKTWGPRFIGIDDIVATKPLADVCSLQWKACIETALNDLCSLKEDADYITIKYEELISSPDAEIDRILSFLEISDKEALHSFSRKRFSSAYIGKWNRISDVELKHRIDKNLRPTLDRLGYK